MTQKFLNKFKMKNQELYVSFSPDIYKQNKANILSIQAELLTTLKHLNNLKKIQKQKSKLKNHIKRISKQVSDEIKQIQEDLPTPSVPKSLHRETPTQIARETKELDNKNKDIDDELRAIEEKLARLNV